MTETITVYRAGHFTAEREPAWLTRARLQPTPPRLPWADAIIRELGTEGEDIEISHSHPSEAGVSYWPLPDGGHYVVFRVAGCRTDTILVPRREDWLAFHVAFIGPFLQAHATVALTDRLHRISNVLVAQACQGVGPLVDCFNEISAFDTRRRRDRLAP